MKRSLLPCLLLVAGCATHIDEVALVNPGFETQASAQNPVPGWRFAQHVGEVAYDYGIDTQTAAEGHASFRIHRVVQQVYGSIEQSVPVTTQLGHRADLSARMKSADVGPKGWVLVMSVVAPSGTQQFRSPPMTGTHDFSEVHLRAKLPDDVQTISIGVILRDKGTGWADDILRAGSF